MADILKKLIDQVQSAVDERQSIVVRGANTKAFLGRTTPTEAMVIDVKKHSGILSYQPVELVLTARAGTSITELEAALDEQNQMLAFEPPRFGGAATIGGTLASNLSGPGRPWWGSVRDHLLGVRIINGRAEHLKFGGQVMKNVAGYDLSRLQAGAMGGLGLMTELSFKVLPKPAVELTLVFDCNQAEAIELMNKRAAEPKPITAATWISDKLYIRLAGAGSAVEATRKAWGGELVEEGKAFWQSVQDRELELFNSSQPIWRFSINPTAKPLELDGSLLVNWGGAERWYTGDYDMDQLVKMAEAAGGQVSLYRGGNRVAEVNHPIAKPLQDLQKRIKTSIDPKGIFNPGRVYSWL